MPASAPVFHYFSVRRFFRKDHRPGYHYKFLAVPTSNSTFHILSPGGRYFGEWPSIKAFKENAHTLMRTGAFRPQEPTQPLARLEVRITLFP